MAYDLSNVTKMHRDNITTNLTINGSIDLGISVENSHVEFKFYIDKYVISSIAIFGILGNLLNIAVLTRRQFHKNLAKLERSALLGLITLAVSDFFVCLSFFPKVFLPDRYRTFKIVPLHLQKNFWFYWDMYSEAAANTFIVWSTWLTVSMAISRYVALCHPMKAPGIVGMTSTKVYILITFVFSVVLNLPYFWIYRSGMYVLYHTYYFIELSDFGHSFTYTVIRWVQAFLGTFVPIGTLILCNASLARTLHKSAALRRQCTRQEAPNDDKRHRITLTLVIIIILYLACVAPSRLIEFVIDQTLSSQGSLSPSSFLHVSSNISYIVALLNLAVAANYAMNFLLYCLINVYFRNVVKIAVKRMLPCVKFSAREERRGNYSLVKRSSGRTNTMETWT